MPTMHRTILVISFALTSLLAGSVEDAVTATTAFQAGASSIIITPPVGSWQQGAGVTKKGERILDDLEANALYLNDGITPLLLLSCDLVGLDLATVTPIRQAIAAETPVPERQVIITCTHNHSGPSLVKTNFYMPVDDAYIASLGPKLVQISKAAVASAKPAKLGWGKGRAQIGYNRRVCWEDGSHTMHGDTNRPDFAGLEGPDDPDHLAVFAVDLEGQPIAVLYNNTSHPTNFYGAGLFSADYPGAARTLLRNELGNIPVLYLNGAQGDINMANLLEAEQEDPEARMARIGKVLAEETLRLYRQAEFHERVQLGHEVNDLELTVRMPDPATLEEAKQVVARMEAGEMILGMPGILAFGTVHLQETYGENPVDTMPVHALRIGDVALLTQPCELYCQFGIDIKRRSPTPFTAVVGLADGYCGYCPTIAGILGGGYSGQPISWTRLEPYAGYKLVEAAGPMLNRLWRDGKVSPDIDNEQ